MLAIDEEQNGRESFHMELLSEFIELRGICQPWQELRHRLNVESTRLNVEPWQGTSTQIHPLQPTYLSSKCRRKTCHLFAPVTIGEASDAQAMSKPCNPGAGDIKSVKVLEECESRVETRRKDERLDGRD